MDSLSVKLIIDRIDKVERDAREANRALRKDVNEVSKNVNKILLWRATIVGGAIVTSALVGFATQFMVAWVSK